MKLLFFTDARLTQIAGNKFFSDDESFSYQMFKRYLNVFDQVFIVARSAIAVRINFVDKNTLVNNIGVTVLPLPYYIGPCQYLKTKGLLLKMLRYYIDSNSDAAMICRVPGAIGTAAARYLIRKDKSYGVEVVGDPHDVFSRGSFNHPLRSVFKYIGTNNLKYVVQHANAVIYVTRDTLKSRYPTKSSSFCTHASNVMLPSEAFAFEAKTLKSSSPFSIVTVGSLSAMYKSADIAIETLVILKQRKICISWQWLGDGRYRPAMMALAKKLGVTDVISFAGNIGSAAEVRAYLDNADLFVQPSRTEGLPRALVEAMARGLPCIGTNIGGIPELLDEIALVPINDSTRLAEKIELFLSTSGLADAQAKRNLLVAKNYASNILDARRNQFYEYLKSIS